MNKFDLPISEKDDVNMRLFKEAFNRRGVSFDEYKDRFGSMSDFSNTKTLLTQHHKLSSEKFVELCKMLGFDWTVTMTDKTNGNVTGAGTVASQSMGGGHEERDCLDCVTKLIQESDSISPFLKNSDSFAQAIASFFESKELCAAKEINDGFLNDMPKEIEAMLAFMNMFK